MGFFDSQIFQSLLSGGIIVYFMLIFYSVFKKQSVKITLQEIKDWYNGLEGEEE